MYVAAVIASILEFTTNRLVFSPSFVSFTQSILWMERYHYQLVLTVGRVVKAMLENF